MTIRTTCRAVARLVTHSRVTSRAFARQVVRIVMHSRAPVWRLDSPTMNYDYVRPPKTCNTTIARPSIARPSIARPSYDQLRPATTSYDQLRPVWSQPGFWTWSKTSPRPNSVLRIPATTRNHPGLVAGLSTIPYNFQSQTIVTCCKLSYPPVWLGQWKQGLSWGFERKLRKIKQNIFLLPVSFSRPDKIGKFFLEFINKCFRWGKG